MSRTVKATTTTMATSTSQKQRPHLITCSEEEEKVMFDHRQTMISPIANERKVLQQSQQLLKQQFQYQPPTKPPLQPSNQRKYYTRSVSTKSTTTTYVSSDSEEEEELEDQGAYYTVGDDGSYLLIVDNDANKHRRKGSSGSISKTQKQMTKSSHKASNSEPRHDWTLAVYDSPSSTSSEEDEEEQEECRHIIPASDLGDLCDYDDGCNSTSSSHELAAFYNLSSEDDISSYSSDEGNEDDILERMIEESSNRWKTSVEELVSSTVTATSASFTCGKSLSCRNLARPLLSRTATDPSTTSTPSRTIPTAAAAKLIEEQQTEIERLRSMLKEREEGFLMRQNSLPGILSVAEPIVHLEAMNQQMMAQMMANNKSYSSFMQHTQQHQQQHQTGIRVSQSMNNLASYQWATQSVPPLVTPQQHQPVVENHDRSNLVPAAVVTHEEINGGPATAAVSAPFEHIEVQVFNSEDDHDVYNSLLGDDLTVWSGFNVETKRPEAEDGSVSLSSPPPSSSKKHTRRRSRATHRRNLSGLSCESASSLTRRA